MDTFVTFQKFNKAEETTELVELLNANQIPFQLEDTSPTVDITFSGDTINNEIRVKVKQEDFDRANKLLEELAKSSVTQIDKDHYLFSFSDTELIEILEKPDEWGKEDYVSAQQLLKSRGREFTDQQINELKQKRLEQLRQPEKGHRGWMIFGFMVSLVGGLLGIFIGWFHMTFKKTLPNGERVYAYDHKTRQLGEKIFLVGIVSFIVWIISVVIRLTK